MSDCASKPIVAFTKGRLLFKPEEYFAGRTHSWGVFETGSGKPTQIDMSQWIVLQGDGRTMINLAAATKAGGVLAEGTEKFRKDR